jgi:hypothetical protein
MRKMSVAAACAVIALAPALASAQSGAWLHVRVEEAKKASRVHVNLPMGVVEAFLKATPDLIEKHGKIHIGEEHGMKLEDLRKAWTELRSVGDAELVTVESEEENVRVARKGDIVQVLVDKKARPAAEAAPGEKPTKARAGEEVRIEVPVSLVDAFLSGTGDEPNMQAAIAELQKRRGDIVRVRDGESDVRVWIDEQNQQAAPAR